MEALREGRHVKKVKEVATTQARAKKDYLDMRFLKYAKSVDDTYDMGDQGRGGKSI